MIFIVFLNTHISFHSIQWIRSIDVVIPFVVCSKLVFVFIFLIFVDHPPRIDEDDDEIAVNDQDVQRLIIVTQVDVIRENDLP